ncbi:histidine triad nucleotide-binding protein [Bifidobacterium bombi]|uniref:Histidine triad (HIT) protein, scavenger mRNA decapping enzyme n=1 Tax=Bifidobacterium bombi DSM 19703 TaxID=1341695 RepID=A0A080N489_9BIFI|nr:histidine triad nucleotide-binding protein [Bifidobacterium bombi]KFF31140.1 histidine triad (HIT) protein, scavenger mRNA decapping enzyme [Bifidobacterium bombi DSM 19703]
MNDDCLFCKIIAGDVPCDKVYEDETTLAFRDVHPMAKVHVLVVPKEHYANVAQVAQSDPVLAAHMLQVAQRIADAEYNGSFRLVCNTGEDAGQSVFHAHMHVLTGQRCSQEVAF